MIKISELANDSIKNEKYIPYMSIDTMYIYIHTFCIISFLTYELIISCLSNETGKLENN